MSDTWISRHTHELPFLSEWIACSNFVTSANQMCLDGI